MSTSAITDLVANTNRPVTGDDVEGSPYDVCIQESRSPNRACLLLYEDARAAADVCDTRGDPDAPICDGGPPIVVTRAAQIFEDTSY